MRPARYFILVLLLELFDLFILNVSIFGAMWVISFTKNEELIISYDVLSFVAFILYANITLLGFNYFFKTHRSPPFRYISIFIEFKKIIKVVAACSLSMFMISPILSIKVLDINFYNIFIIFFCTSLIGVRFAQRVLLNFLRSRGFNARNIAIIGKNIRSMEFINSLEKNRYLGFNILGFIDDEHNDSNYSSSIDNAPPVICTLAEFKNFIRSNCVDEIAIFLPVKSRYNRIKEIIDICQEHGIIVRYSSNIFDSISTFSSKVTSVHVDNFFFITMITGKVNGWKTLIKRLFDIFVSAVLLVILLPLFVIVGIAIKITSPGPVFFVQKRIGLNKREINLFKFRTMIVEAEQQLDKLENQNEADGPVFKLKNDPRITPIGSFLRKSSIDELPQLFNVFLGNMSLVGPRPLPIRDFKGFYQDNHRRRFSVKPGITCTWQIHGRHKVSFEQWMTLDLKYIDNWSLWLDLKIILGTIPAVLKFKRAS